MSDHYTVLARRFRPQTFDDVVGQEHVGRAIQNAIKAGRVAHAYLFTGARGVGKTSTARIFAKALNCPDVQDGVPCNICDVCDAIGNGSDVDVLEIDGASNRGIDDIRQLRANVNIRSMRSPFKVYIIDEVHMLTKEAFNALLKTLEEPPPNVKFIFCTTEPQKVPDTILSRCQRFDFGTITSERIGNRLNEIAAAEGVSVDDEAVAMVARRAAGSMRDSQSLFDQLLAFGGETISAADVHRLFGTAPDERIVSLVAAILQQDRATALKLIDESLNSGVRLDSLTDQLVAYVRDLMVLASGAASVELASVSSRLKGELAQQAAEWGLRTAMAALQILSDTKLKMSRTVHGRPLLELAIVRLSMLEDLDGLASLVQAARAGTLPGIAIAADTNKKKTDPIPVEQTQPAVALTPPPPHREADCDQSLDDDSQQEEAAPPVITAAPPTAPQPAVDSSTPPPVARSEQSPQEPASEATIAAKNADSSNSVNIHSPPSVHAPPTTPLTPDTFDDFWARLVKLVPERLGVALTEARSCELLDNGHVAVTTATEFSLSFLKSDPTQKRLASLTSEMTGSPVTFDFRVESSGAVPTSLIRDRQVEPQLKKKSVVDEDQFVQSALELFGGQLVQVKSAPAPVVEVSEVDPELEDVLDVEDEEDA